MMSLKTLSQELLLSITAAMAMPTLVIAQQGDFCQFPEAEIIKKEALRSAAFDPRISYSAQLNAQKQYAAIVQRHQQSLRECRQKSWLKNQGIWLRLYPCDLETGRLEALLDRITNRGYNQIFVEILTDGKVLLPEATNFSPWTSLITGTKYKQADLLQMTIERGRARGLQVYAWIFSLNFGRGYAQGRDRNGNPQQTVARQRAIALNGKGEKAIVDRQGKTSEVNIEQLFVDPYNRQAQIDLYGIVTESLRRQPDGVVFDYIRYRRGTGADSVVSNVRDLWIYGEASLQALRDRAQNQQGRVLIDRFLKQGFVTATDLQAVKKLYPTESAPQWQGLQPIIIQGNKPPTATIPLSYWQNQLWRLAVGHAFIGITYYLNVVSRPVFQQRVTAGIAFFPDGNQPVGNGFDSRMQPWHLFTNNYIWQPMTYAACGQTDCIINQVLRVTNAAPPATRIAPILVGQWQNGENLTTVSDNRPSLDAQMLAIRQAVPSISSISHFAFNWQNEHTEFNRSRQFCRLQN
ncbi:MAG: family 10 glycosylhydrolase [Pseudanabaenaceae cyanobacterium bins.39]|nr:family 10 glycosylhydrolase [Pseudanabaenaceae cyanobacterium bins.39]